MRVSSLSFMNLSSQSMRRLESKDGPQDKIPISKPTYQRPKHDRVYCKQCDDHPDGFRGEHEFRRHQDRQHPKPVKKWVCVQPQQGLPDIVKPFIPLSKCKACTKQKRKYRAYYNAAAHLRRAHFRPTTKEERKRGGYPGGGWPSMADLKVYMMEVEEPATDFPLTVAQQQEEDESSDPLLDLDEHLISDMMHQDQMMYQQQMAGWQQNPGQQPPQSIASITTPQQQFDHQSQGPAKDPLQGWYNGEDRPWIPKGIPRKEDSIQRIVPQQKSLQEWYSNEDGPWIPKGIPRKEDSIQRIVPQQQFDYQSQGPAKDPLQGWYSNEDRPWIPKGIPRKEDSIQRIVPQQQSDNQAQGPDRDPIKEWYTSNEGPWVLKETPEEGNDAYKITTQREMVQQEVPPLQSQNLGHGQSMMYEGYFAKFLKLEEQNKQNLQRRREELANREASPEQQYTTTPVGPPNVSTPAQSTAMSGATARPVKLPKHLQAQQEAHYTFERQQTQRGQQGVSYDSLLSDSTSL